MRKTKESKAITLIALVITIVIILIIASITISSIDNYSILIKQATNAKRDYEDMATAEQKEFEYMAGSIENNIDKYVKSSDKTIKIVRNDKSITILHVGDILKAWKMNKDGNLEENINDAWYVLGVEDGKLKVVLLSNNYGEEITLSGLNGYLNGVETLDSECNNKYNRITGVSSARSIKVEDINEFCNYEVEQGEYVKYAYKESSNWVYGKKATGKSDIDISGLGSDSSWTDNSIGTTLVTPYWTLGNGSETPDIKIRVVENTAYGYTISQNVADENDPLSELLSNNIFWLSSPYTQAYANSLSFGLRCIQSDELDIGMLYNNTNQSTLSLKVLPVLLLDEDAIIEFKNNN